MFENANFKIVEMHIIDFYLNLQEVYDSSVFELEIMLSILLSYIAKPIILW